MSLSRVDAELFLMAEDKLVVALDLTVSDSKFSVVLISEAVKFSEQFIPLRLVTLTNKTTITIYLYTLEIWKTNL